MMEDDHEIIEMNLEGEFVSPDPGGKPPLGARVMLWAIVAALLAITALIVALTFWFVIMILPAVLLMGVVAWLTWRYQLWRARHGVIWRGPPSNR
jgi:hypothetical protein